MLEDFKNSQGVKASSSKKFREALSIIECPRDAMQGWHNFIATEKKITYLNALLQCGFDTLDFGSFVSPKAIPQMADTAKVLGGLKMDNSNTKLLAIIANERGAADAVAYEQISYLGFPFSVSETFQQRNANSTINESLKRVEAIQLLCEKNNKNLVVYISMGFGNPYGDLYNEEIVIKRTKQIAALGIKTISIADTVGLATAFEVGKLMKSIIPEVSNVEVGVHLHSAAKDREFKIEAALNAGCKRFDAAINGIGGCPMAGNELVGNMDTEVMLQYLESKGYNLNIDKLAIKKCSLMANEIFV
ncbi:MAG: hydroxymethylglutaryl-CoA lyase [Ferruginibacter sp.]|nr:hydroxymethylglutaryl-CoA lyase [Ferruginibacter sp.]